MPIFNIGSGNPYKLPVLDSAYPVDVTQLQQADGSATFEVKITTAGIPDEYTYQWMVWRLLARHLRPTPAMVFLLRLHIRSTV